MWKGAAETLNASPARIIASPARRNASSPALAAAICEKPISPVAPYTSAEPKRSTAEPNPPTIRYLRAASSEAARSVSNATRTYRQSENHSSPRKSVIRFPAPTKNTIPAPAVARSA